MRHDEFFFMYIINNKYYKKKKEGHELFFFFFISFAFLACFGLCRIFFYSIYIFFFVSKQSIVTNYFFSSGFTRTRTFQIIISWCNEFYLKKNIFYFFFSFYFLSGFDKNDLDFLFYYLGSLYIYDIDTWCKNRIFNAYVNTFFDIFIMHLWTCESVEKNFFFCWFSKALFRENVDEL